MAKTHEGGADKDSAQFEKVRGLSDSKIKSLVEGFEQARKALKEVAQSGIKSEEFEKGMLEDARNLLTVVDYKYSLLKAAEQDPEARDWGNNIIDTARVEAVIKTVEEALGVDLEVTDDEVYEALKTLKESGETDIDNVDAGIVNDAMDTLEDAKNEREFALKRFAIYGYENDERVKGIRKVLNDINEEESTPEKPDTAIVSHDPLPVNDDVEIIPPQRTKRVGPVIPSNDEIDVEAEVLDNTDEKELSEKTKKSLRGEISGILSEIPETKEKGEEYGVMSDKIKEYSEMSQGEITPALRAEINAFIEQYKPRLKSLRDDAVAKKSKPEILNVFFEDFERLGNLYFRVNPEEKDKRRIARMRKGGIVQEKEVKETEPENIPVPEKSSEANTRRRQKVSMKSLSQKENDHYQHDDGKDEDIAPETKEKTLKGRKSPQKKPKDKIEEARYQEAVAGAHEWFENPEDLELIKTDPVLYGQLLDYLKSFYEKYEACKTQEDKDALKKAYETFTPGFFEKFQELKAKQVNKEEQPEQPPRPLSRLPIEQIFIMRKGETYTQIGEDREFDVWMKSLYRQMDKNNEADQDNARDIEAWHQEYLESAEHRQKLIEIFADIQNSPDKMDVMVSAEKIQSLLYDLYRKSDETREKIDAIHASYQKSKENSKVKELEDKILSMRIEIGNDRQSNRNGELKPEQIKTILESRGTENTSENISEISFFLKNLDNQYDMYMGGKKEGESNEVVKAYRRYTASGYDTGEKKTGWGRVWSFLPNLLTKFVATIPMSIDYKKFNEFAILVDQVRKLNLVDRKTGNKDAAAHNKHRMESLLNLLGTEADLMHKYVSNPQSIDLKTLSPEKKDLLETFKAMYDKYTTVKYRGDKGKQLAESILQYKPGSISSISREDILSPVDVLFDTSAEKETFKSVAKYEITKRDLSTLEKEIDGFGKRKTDNKKVKELLARFNVIEEAMKKAPERKGEDDINLSKVSIKMKGLILRHTNNEDPVELSSSLKTYDEVLFSPVIDKAERINYVNTLIASLEQQKKSKGNTLIQTAIINDTIEKYKEIREQISK